MDFRKLLKMAADSLYGRPRAANNIRPLLRGQGLFNALDADDLVESLKPPKELTNRISKQKLKGMRGLLAMPIMEVLDKPTKAIGTILGTSLAEMFGASPYNTKGMKMQAGADLGLPGAIRDLNASKNMPVPYRLTDQKLKDDARRQQIKMMQDELDRFGYTLPVGPPSRFYAP